MLITLLLFILLFLNIFICIHKILLMFCFIFLHFFYCILLSIFQPHITIFLNHDFVSKRQSCYFLLFLFCAVIVILLFIAILWLVILDEFHIIFLIYFHFPIRLVIRFFLLNRIQISSTVIFVHWFVISYNSLLLHFSFYFFANLFLILLFLHKIHCCICSFQ